MKRIAGIMAMAISFASSLLWYSCTKDNDEDMTGTIYGIVSPGRPTVKYNNKFLTFAPAAAPDFMGMSLTWSF